MGEWHVRGLGEGAGADILRGPRLGGRRSYGCVLQKSKGRWRACRLTLCEASFYLPKLAFERRTPMDRAAGNEADLQAPQPQAGQQAWIPRADEDQGRTQDAQPAETPRSRPHLGEDRRQVVDGPTSRTERFPRGARLRSSGEFRRLLEHGQRKSTPSLDVFVAPSPTPHSRFGLIVPKLGRRIVERNLLKRRLREIGRRTVLPRLDAAGVHMDVLIRVRARAYGADFEALAGEVDAAVEGLCSLAS